MNCSTKARMRPRVLLVSVALIAGCAVVDPQRVGNGQYLQIIGPSGVVLESDTSNAGLQSCPITAYQMLNTNPALAGKLRCAAVRTQDSLPFSFRAWNQSSAPGDHILNSSPYLTRTSTSTICQQAMLSTKSAPKVVIVEDNCAGK